jgi:hypothetical protein
MRSDKARRALVAMAALALLATSCSDDGDATTDPGPTTTTAPVDDQPDDTTTTSEPEEEIVLTASYRGVTETSIKIGVLLFDLDAILDLGVDVGYGDQTQHFQVVIDEINSEGGILGRQIEPVFRLVSPVDAEAADTACAELVEDEGVFLVVGTARPPANVLCYTESGDTPFVGAPSGDLTDEVFERSVAPFIFPGRRPSRTDGAILAALQLDDAIEGAIIAVHGADADRVESLATSIEELGAAQVIRTVELANEADQVALATELDRFIERYKTDAVDGMVNLGDNVAVLAAFNRASFAVPVWTTSPDVLAQFIYDQGATNDELRLVRLILNETSSELYNAGHGPTVECVDRWNGLRPDEPAVPNAGEDDLSNIGVIVIACLEMDIVKRATTAAGVDLTVESFTSGLDSIGTFESAGTRTASLSSTKWDAGDAAKLFRWSEEEGEIVAAEDLALG